MYCSNNVDFRLASTYIPFFVCVVKILLLTTLVFFATPSGHVLFVAGLLLLDYLHLNVNFIIDISYILCGWFVFQLFLIERNQHGINTHLTLFISTVWSFIPVFRLNSKYAMTLNAACLIFLSNTFFAAESIYWQIARALLYVGYVSVVVSASFLRNTERYLPQIILQAGVILCSHVIICVAFFVIATCASIYDCVKSEPTHCVVDCEAQALRQALAARGGKSVNSNAKD